MIFKSFATYILMPFFKYLNRALYIQTKALAMDRTRAPPADYNLHQNCPTMDSRRPKKEKPPQGNLEENRREGDEGKGLDMGLSGACLS